MAEHKIVSMLKFGNMGLAYASTFILVFVALYVYQIRTSQKLQILAQQNVQVQTNLFADLKDAESGQRGYLHSRREEYLPQYLAAIRNARSDMRVLKQYLSDRPREQKTLTLLSTEVNNKLDELEQTVALGKAGQWAEADAIFNSDKGLVQMEKIRDLFGVLAAQESDDLRKAQASRF